MKKITRDADGMYHIKGKTYKELEGSRACVAHGTAYRTAGGLTKHDICKNRSGKYVSCVKSKQNKENSNLGSLLAPKGSHTFGPRKSIKGTRRLKRTRRRT